MNDWYTNDNWNPEIEQAFFAKLARARSQKAQYLKIQAGALCRNYPEAALMLLERYFQSEDTFFLAQAHSHRAQALIALNRFEEAVASFQEAIVLESGVRGMGTNAAFDFPLLVATRKMKDRYAYAIEVVEKNRKNIFVPSQRFDSHAAFALISFDLGQLEQARLFAEQALLAASSGSPFPRHPGIGLVGASRTGVIKQLQEILSKR